MYIHTLIYKSQNVRNVTLRVRVYECVSVVAAGYHAHNSALCCCW